MKLYHRTHDFRADEEMKKIFANGKAPLLEINFNNAQPPKIIAESGHIANYLIKHYSKEGLFTPENEEGEEEVDFLVQFSEGSLQPYLTFGAALDVAHQKAPILIRGVINKYNNALKSSFISKETEINLEILESILSKNNQTAAPDSLFFVQNRISAADILLQFSVHVVLKSNRLADFPISKFPLLNKWLDQVESRSAFQNAIARIRKEGNDNFKI